MTLGKAGDNEAIKGIRAFRERATREVPELSEALLAESDAEDFCRAVREELRARRKGLGFDQTQLGEIMDLTQSAVSRIERGSGDIGLKTVFRYARAMGLRPFLAFTHSAEAVVAGEDRAAKAVAAAGLDEEQDRILQLLTQGVTTHMAKMTEAFVEQIRDIEAPGEAEEAEEESVSLARTLSNAGI